jgi:hypothetical protein
VDQRQLEASDGRLTMCCNRNLWYCALSDLSPARGVFHLWEWKAGALSGAGDLTTGQSNEMRIYDPDLPFSEYEIAPIQTTGTFSFASCAGYTGRRDTCSHTCTVDLPIETKGLKVSHFCLDCRVLLKDHAENGFVLADLYVEDAIDIYPATVGADYTIRDYRITVSEAKVRSEMELIVLGIAEGLTFVD